MSSRLDGPRLAAASGTPCQLVVFVHGYGADGNDLIGLGTAWQKLLPDAAFVAPHAPARVAGAPPQGPGGYQWFPISRIDPHEMQRGVEMVAPQFDAFLDAELAALKLPPQQLALVGFSQGTMLSLHVGLARRTPPAAIVGFSGMLAGRVPEPAPGGHYPPVFLAHGDSDQVIGPQAMFLAAGALGQAGVDVSWHMARGMGHGIDQQGLEQAGQFLKTAFANSP